jgi:hypothetical protein
MLLEAIVLLVSISGLILFLARVTKETKHK